VFAVFLLAGLGAGAAFLANSGYLTAHVETAVARISGKPCAVDQATLSFFPTPAMRLRGLNAATGEVEIVATEVRVALSWSSLLSSTRVVEHLAFDGLRLRLREDWRADSTAQFAELLPESSPAGGAPAIRLRRVSAPNVVILRGDEQVATVDLDAADLLGAQAHVDFLASLHAVGPEARIRAEIALTVEAGTPRLSGMISGTALELGQMLPREGLPKARLDAEVQLSGTGWADMAADLSGTLDTDAGGGVEGAISARAWHRDGQYIVNGFSWDSPGLLVKADATYAPGGEVAIQVQEARANSSGLTMLLAALPLHGVQLAAMPDASLSVRDLLVGREAGGAPRLATGTAQFAGMQVNSPAGEALLRDLRGNCALHEGMLRFEELAATGVSLAGTAQADLGANALTLALTGEVDLGAVAPLVALVAPTIQKLDGRVRIASLQAVLGGSLPLSETATAELALDGVSFTTTPPEIGPIVIEGASGGLRYAQGKLQLDGLRASGVALSGSVAMEADRYVVDMKASGDLSSPVFAPVLAKSPISNATGAIAFEKIGITYSPTLGMVGPIVLDGKIDNASATLASPGFRDTISGLSSTFRMENANLLLDVTAQSQTLGALRLKGAVDTEKRAFSGDGAADIDRVVGAFTPAGAASDIARALFAGYAGSKFSLSLALPGDDGGDGRLEMSRADAPKASLRATLRRDKNGIAAQAIEAATVVPFAPLAAALPTPATGAGNGSVALSIEGERVQVSADFTAASLELPGYLRKAEGQALTLEARGTRGATGIQLQMGALVILGQEFRFVPHGAGFASENLDLNLAAIAPLLPNGGAARGRVTGRVQSEPPGASLRLDGLHWSTPQQVMLERVDGGLSFVSGAWGFEQLQVQAFGSDLTLNGSVVGGEWQGNLSGRRLDFNAVEQARLLLGGAGAGASAALDNAAIRGNIKIALDELLFRKATLQNIATTAKLDAESVLFSDLRAGAYGGTVSGEVAILMPKNAPQRTRVDIVYESVDLRILDDLSPNDPRGMYGPASGAIQLTAPSGEDATPYMGLDGEATLRAVDGSWGKAGASGRVLAALRATDVAQLELPSLRDRGLSFQTSNARLLMREGVVTIDQFDLQERSHSLTANGIIDFPGDTLDVTIRFQLLENVRNIVGAIPVLKALSEAGGLYIHLTGSPTDPKASSTRVRPLKEIRDTGGGLIKEVFKPLRRNR